MSYNFQSRKQILTLKGVYWAIVPWSRIPSLILNAQWVQFLKWRPVNKLDQTLLSKCMYSWQGSCFFCASVNLLLYFAIYRKCVDLIQWLHQIFPVHWEAHYCYAAVRERKRGGESESERGNRITRVLTNRDVTWATVCFSFLPSECFFAYWLTDVNDKLGYDARPLTHGLDNVHVPSANGEIPSYFKICEFFAM